MQGGEERVRDLREESRREALAESRVRADALHDLTIWPVYSDKLRWGEGVIFQECNQQTFFLKPTVFSSDVCKSSQILINFLDFLENRKSCEIQTKTDFLQLSGIPRSSDKCL